MIFRKGYLIFYCSIPLFYANWFKLRPPPLDTSLNFTQTRKLINEVRPRCLVVPERYTRPPHSAPNRYNIGHTSI